MKKLKIILLLINLSALISCSNNQTLKSAEIDEKSERIAIFKNQLNTFSEIADAEFDLFNSNGFDRSENFALGPTDKFYNFVVKVKPEHVSAWKNELVEVDGKPENEAWMHELTKKRAENWLTHATPKFYKRKGDEQSLIVIFEADGIIYAKIIST